MTCAYSPSRDDRRIELPAELRWCVERGPYYPAFGRELERSILVGSGSSLTRGVTRIERVG